MNWNEIQKAHAEWQERNFGKQPADWMVLGMIEELGELDGACERGDKPEIIDAVGDILVYAMGLHTILGWEMQESYNKYKTRMEIKSHVGFEHSIAGLQGKLAHHILKSNQNIRGGREHHKEMLREKVVDVFVELQRTLDVELNAEDTSEHVYSLDSVLTAVWNKVSKRDWKKDKANGGES